MELIANYFNAKKDLLEYFGYKTDWVEIPLSDDTDVYWGIAGDDLDGEVRFCYNESTLDSLDEDDIYSHSIYTQRFLTKYVYRGKDYTSICVDTHIDGNKFLSIFDNKKERDVSKFNDI